MRILRPRNENHLSAIGNDLFSGRSAIALRDGIECGCRLATCVWQRASVASVCGSLAKWERGAATGKAPTAAAESSSHALPLHFGKFFHGLMVSALTGGAF